MNSRSASVSPCRTPARILKKLVFPCGDLTSDLVSLYSIIMASSVSAVERFREVSENNSGFRFFALTPSNSFLTVRIWPCVDLVVILLLVMINLVA